MSGVDVLGKPLRDCRIGVAGCGAMGLPMLRQLIAHGFDARGFDVRPLPQFASHQALMEMDSARFGAHTDILISVVRDAAQNADLCFDVQKIFAAACHPRVLIISSTLSPAQFHDIAGRLPQDVTAIDAPMSGAPVAAEAGTLTFMVGADGEWFASLQPLFAAMGGKINHLGAPGSGMSVKVLNNYVAACSVVAVRTVLARAAALGVDPARLLDIMRQSSGGTWFGDHFDRIDWARQGYDPGNTIGILEKDVGCALVAAGQGETGFDRALLDALRALQPTG